MYSYRVLFYAYWSGRGGINSLARGDLAHACVAMGNGNGFYYLLVRQCCFEFCFD